jgi:excisionase family DNA binding protein
MDRRVSKKADASELIGVITPKKFRSESKPIAKSRPNLEALLTVEDLAGLLRLSTKGIYSLVENRKIPFIKVSNRVRFLPEDVMAWVRENRVPALEVKP